MYDLIIIGAGPAGLTAALYAGRSRLNTLVLERMLAGGRILLTETIENFPGFLSVSTQELTSKMTEQIKQLDVKIESKEVLDVDCKSKVVKTQKNNYSAKSIIIATGAKPRKLGVPGEDKLTGKGVSYCATCDGPLFKDKTIAVVGGGNAVAEEALYLARFAKTVHVIHRRDALRASSILQEKLKENKKINFILNSLVGEVCGVNKVESVKIINKATKKEEVLSCDGVFVYIGYDPDTGFLKNKLNLDESGFIMTDENLATSEAGVFACGDCRRKSLYQVVTACADGAIAADSAYKYLSK